MLQRRGNLKTCCSLGSLENNGFERFFDRIMFLIYIQSMSLFVNNDLSTNKKCNIC